MAHSNSLWYPGKHVRMWESVLNFCVCPVSTVLKKAQTFACFICMNKAFEINSVSKHAYSVHILTHSRGKMHHSIKKFQLSQKAQFKSFLSGLAEIEFINIPSQSHARKLFKIYW